MFDPFCGSGSNLVAAVDEGCDYLGIELEHRHHQTAGRRLAFSPLQQIPKVAAR